MSWNRFTIFRLAIFALSITSILMLTSRAFAASAIHLHSASGQGSGISASADNSFSDAGAQTMELTGHVQIIYDQQYLSCDHAVINRATEEVFVEGNLVISSPQVYIEGDSANLSYKDNTGTITNGFVKSGPVIFEGRIVKKTGPQSFDAEDASFTACTTCPTAWTFSGSRIQAELGGYAYIKHAKMRVANIPMLWLPYLIVPLKSQRSTGILIPSIDDNSDGGTALAQSFFWAISRSQDATITAKYYTKRGWKALVNYRYVLNPTSSGELSSSFVRDNVFPDANGIKGYNTDVNKNRYFLTYNHNYDLPDGFNQKLNLNVVSDLRYTRDFPEEMAGSGDSALDNRLTLSRNTERTHASLDASYYINQLHENLLDSNTESVHRVPELRYDIAERPVSSTGIFSGLLFNFHSDYVNFTRDSLAWDDVYTNAQGVKTVDRARDSTLEPGAGIFDPKTDVIRTGQRIDLQPEISAPFRIGSVLDVLPSLNFRHTQYALNVPESVGFDSNPYRQYLRGRVSFRTRFSRVYGDNSPVAETPRVSVTNWSDDESRTATDAQNSLKAPTVAPITHPDVYRHEIEPELVVAGVRDTHNTDTQTNQFLGTVAQVPSFLDSQPVSDADFLGARGIQFDYEDRLTNRNTISAFLSNRLVKKSWLADGSAVYKQIASFKLGQSYDFDEPTAPRPASQRFPYSDISALLDLRLDHFETNTLLRYFPYHGKTNTSSRARVMDDFGRYLEVNFVQNYLITIDTLDADRNHTETVGLSAGFLTKFVNFAGTIDFNPKNIGNFEFITKSWSMALNIKPPGDCWGILITLTQDLSGVFNKHLTFQYNFGGGVPKIAPVQ